MNSNKKTSSSASFDTLINQIYSEDSQQLFQELLQKEKKAEKEIAVNEAKIQYKFKYLVYENTQTGETLQIPFTEELFNTIMDKIFASIGNIFKQQLKAQWSHQTGNY